MKTKDLHQVRSENAKHEKRDSEGRFTSKDNNHSSRSSNQPSHHKNNDYCGENSWNEDRDAEGRFTSK